MEEKIEKKKEPSSEAELVDVATQTDIACKLPDGKVLYTEKEMLLQIINDLQKLKRGLL